MVVAGLGQLVAGDASKDWALSSFLLIGRSTWPIFHLMVARWLLQLQQDSRVSPRTPCWCLIGQIWVTWSLVAARDAGNANT